MSVIARAIDVGYGNVKYSRVTGGLLEYREFPAMAIPAVAQDIEVRGMGMARNDTLIVETNGRLYHVGPETPSLQRNLGARELDPTYSRGDRYAALTLGALAYMNEPNIDCLVLGLPLSTFQAEKGRLEQVWTRRHEVPIIGEPTAVRRTVEVRRVTVVPQPLGAYMRAIDEGMLRPELGHTLVIDVGYHTLDWVVMTPRGAVLTGAFGALQGGVAKLMSAISTPLKRDLGRPIPLTPIEIAWRASRSAFLYGRAVSLHPYMGQVEALIETMVAELCTHLGDHSDIHHVVIAGGGAPAFASAVRAKLEREVSVLECPELANIKGFQIIANSLAKRQQTAVSA